ncbi:MAG: outer membrane beta-barrel protein [Saprospiraceae bacterium]|nr:outer membrane beta-barrel protein [Saprospiraceae bacterium]
MKKIQLLPLLFAMVTVAALKAQTTQGTIALGLHNFSPLVAEVGGLLAPSNALGIAFTTQKGEIDGEESDTKLKSTTIGLSGSAHYFIIDNLSAGINLNVLSQTQKEDGGQEDNESSLTLLMAGPELRYYIPATEKMKVFVNAGAAFGTAKSKFNGEEDGDPTKLSRFGGSAGLAFFPNQHVSIDLGLGYGAFITKDTYNFGGDDIESKSTTSGVTFEVGFTVFL